MVTIRTAQPGDLDRLMEIFDCARRFMRATGNLLQWNDGYPSRTLMEEQIASGYCYVCCDAEGAIAATFCFIPGPDPTYADITEGAWPDNEPYYVIHRLASDGSQRGIGSIVLDWCRQRSVHLRVDTHADNHVMHNLLTRNGFVRCGIIHVANGTPRVAYALDKNGE